MAEAEAEGNGAVSIDKMITFQHKYVTTRITIDDPPSLMIFQVTLCYIYFD